MKIDHKELLNALNIIKAGVSDRDIIEESKHFVFTGKNIITYNGELCLSYPFETDFKCSIPANEFHKIINNRKYKDLDLTLKNGKLHFTCDDTKGYLVTSSGEDIIKIIESVDINNKKEKWKNLSEDFYEGIDICLLLTSKDRSRKVHSFLYINKEDIVATDNYSISRFKMSKGIEDSFLLSKAGSQQILGIKPNKYRIVKSWLHFKSESGAILGCLTIQDDFPSYKKFLKVEGYKIQLPEEIKSAIDVSSVMTEGSFDLDKKVDIKITKDSLICSGTGTKGTVNRSVPFKYDGEDVEFGIVPTLLLRVLDKKYKMIIGDAIIKLISGKFSHVISTYNS